MAEIDFSVLERSKVRQAEFAELVGVSRATVNCWCNNRGMGVHHLRVQKVTKYLGAFEGALRDNDLPLKAGIHRLDRMETIRKILLTQLKKG